MDIGKYSGYFHDGYVNDVTHKGNNIEFALESCVIDPNEIENRDEIVLSRSNTLKGSLLLHNIKNIKLDNKEYNGIIQKQYDDGEILDLEVENNIVFLLVEWKNFPPKVRAAQVSKIEIEAEKVQWIPEHPEQNNLT